MRPPPDSASAAEAAACAIDCEAEATTEAASIWASARKRRIVSGGWISNPAACRCTCSVRVATIIPSPSKGQYQKNTTCPASVNDFVFRWLQEPDLAQFLRS